MSSSNSGGCGDGHVVTMTVFSVEEHQPEVKGYDPSPEHTEMMNLVCTPGQIILIQEKEPGESGYDHSISPCSGDHESMNLFGADGPQSAESVNDESNNGGNETYVTELRVYIPEGDYVTTEGESNTFPGTEDHGTMTLVGVEGQQSAEMFNENSTGGHEPQGNEAIVCVPAGDYATVVFENSTSFYTPEPALDQSSGSDLDHSGNRTETLGHEPVAGSTDELASANNIGSLASSGVIVKRHVVSSYSLDYQWSPLLKYCKPEELGIRLC